MVYGYLLVLDDELFAPTLALARQVCQPGNRLKPHLTVRYPVHLPIDERTAVLYDEPTTKWIRIEEAGAFSPQGGEKQDQSARSVVFLKCSATELERLAYKPDYPNSVFHFTLYEGSDIGFASSLLELLREFNWGLRVDLSQRAVLDLVPAGQIRVDDSRWRTSAEYLAKAIDLLSVHDAFRGNRVLSKLDRNTGRLNRLAVAERLSILRGLLEPLQSYFDEGGKGPDSQEPKTYSIAATTIDDSAIVEEWRSVSRPSQQVLFSERSSSGIASARTRRDERSVIDDVHAGHDPLARPMLPELAREVVSTTVDHIWNCSRPDDIRFGSFGSNSRIIMLTLAHVMEKEGFPSPTPIVLSEGELRELSAFSKMAQTPDDHPARNWDLRETSVLERARTQRCTLMISNLADLSVRSSSRALGPAEHERWRSILVHHQVDRAVNNRPYDYTYVMLFAHAWMEQDAIAAWIIPSGFMDRRQGSTLRRYLSTRVELLRVHNYERRFFSDRKTAEEYSVVILRNRLPRSGHRIRWSRGSSISECARSESPVRKQQLDVELDCLRNSPKWWFLYARSLCHEDGSVTLGSLFDVQYGLRIPLRSPLVISRTAAEQIGWSRHPILRIFPSLRRLLRGCADLGDVRDATVDSLSEDVLILPIWPRFEERPDVEDKYLRSSWIRSEELEKLVRVMRKNPGNPGELPMDYLVRLEKILRRDVGLAHPDLLAAENPSQAPILLAMSSRWDESHSPFRFVRNRSSHIVLRNYMTLRCLPRTRHMMAQSGLTIDDLFGSLQQVERDIFHSHAVFHRPEIRRLRLEDVRNIPLPEGRIVSCFASASQ